MDLRAHKLSAAVLVACWLIPVCLDVFGWRKPLGRDDMLPSVAYMILFSAVLAGALIGWWRRSETAQVSGGMLGGGVLLALAAAAIVVPQMAPVALGPAPDGESIFELPVMLLLVGLVGAVLGLIGAGATVAVYRLLGGRKPDYAAIAPGVQEQWPARRMRFVAAALALAAALIIAVAVIPPIAADYFPGAAPARASKAFGVNAGANVGVGLVLLAPFARRRTHATRTILTIAAFVALLLGFMLLSAVGIVGHGRAMFVAAIASAICATADLVAAGLTFWTVRS